MDFITDKLWAVAAALISALGGYVVYERKKIDGRLSKLESELVEHKVDVAVVQESLKNLKEDTQEIKEAQKALIDLLTNRRRK